MADGFKNSTNLKNYFSKIGSSPNFNGLTLKNVWNNLQGRPLPRGPELHLYSTYRGEITPVKPNLCLPFIGVTQ